MKRSKGAFFFREWANTARELSGSRTDCEVPAYMLLRQICGYWLEPKDKANPFRAVKDEPENQTPGPSDLTEEEVQLLADVADKISNSGVIARFCDIAFFISRKKYYKQALKAIDAYVDGAREIYSRDTDRISPLFRNCGIQYIQRACVLMNMLNWNQSKFDSNKSDLAALLEKSRTNRPDDYPEIANAALDFGFGNLSSIAETAEKMSIPEDGDILEYLHFEALKTAICAQIKMKNKTEVDRLLERGALSHVSEALKSDKTLLKIYPLDQALSYLRRMTTESLHLKKVEGLHREAQAKVVSDLKRIPIETDLTEMIRAVQSGADGLSFHQAIGYLVFCVKWWPAPAIEKPASRLANLFTTQMLARDGRTVHHSFGDNKTDEQMESRIRRSSIVNGHINAIRHLLAHSFPLIDHTFLGVIHRSPYIPPGHHEIVSMGMDAFIRGDDIVAAHLLIPQLEAMLLHILKLNGVDTIRTNDHGNQDTATLTKMLSRYRQELGAALDPTIIDEIDGLFDFRGGPRLRNCLAHGEMTIGELYGPDIAYGNWFIIHLALLPLLPHWDKFHDAFPKQAGMAVRLNKA